MRDLAYWCETQPESIDRRSFNTWFADRKAIRPARVSDLEASLSAKGFLAREHQSFRFNYQKYYFLASFIRSNPNRSGIREYVAKLVSCCWNEDYANTALFLAYLQPSSFLVDALLAEVGKLFPDKPEFNIKGWEIDAQFPKGFFQGLTFSSDPETNRRLLTERLDETSPIGSAECPSPSFPGPTAEDLQPFLDFLKGFHLIKLIGQLIRNSPIAFDAQQKHDLVRAGFSLDLRLVSFAGEVCGPAALKAMALAQLRERVLKKVNRVELEAKLSGLIYGISHFLVFAVLRHACYYLAHPDLSLVYQGLLRLDSSESGALTHQVLACGLQFELRSPDAQLLRKVYRRLTPSGQDILRTWAWFFLWYNRVLVSKRQAIL